jgi:hypothetical protein
VAWVHLLGRKVAAALADPKFDLLLNWPYWNRFGRQGQSYYGSYQGRKFCVSQSKQEEPDTMAKLSRVFRDGNAIDVRVGPFYSNKRRQTGLVVAAWYGSQWVQAISPGTSEQPDDDFSRLAGKIRDDRSVDPRPFRFDALTPSSDSRLQELEDILKNLRGRPSFDW